MKHCDSCRCDELGKNPCGFCQSGEHGICDVNDCTCEEC